MCGPQQRGVSSLKNSSTVYQEGQTAAKCIKWGKQCQYGVYQAGQTAARCTKSDKRDRRWYGVPSGTDSGMMYQVGQTAARCIKWDEERQGVSRGTNSGRVCHVGQIAVWCTKWDKQQGVSSGTNSANTESSGTNRGKVF